MPATKECPECFFSVNVKKSMCECGHSFTLKRRVNTYFGDKRTTRKLKMTKRKTRATQTAREAKKRQVKDSASRASKRALETSAETLVRQEEDRVCTARKRASETQAETLLRQEEDRVYTARKRASETQAETLFRQEEDRVYTARKRASETQAETLLRQEADRLCTARKRASETQAETLHRLQKAKASVACKRASQTQGENLSRCEQEQARMAKKRSMTISVDKAISGFLSKAKCGPDFVCTCCHRLMYRQTVVPYNRSKYSKASESVLQQVFCDEYRYLSSDGNVWVCKTCDGALMRGSVPVQAKANNLQLSTIPPELSDLNPLELRLISLRIPFLKMVGLPSGKQRCIHGPAVNVPSKVDSICSVLPRLPSQTELVPLKLKRKMAYRKHYMYSFISPEKLLNALRWLKANNPLYSDIDINSDWLGESLRDDKDLFDSLVEPTGASNNDGESELSHGEPSTTVTSGDQLNLPSIQPSLGNSISSAKSTLERVASSNGFVVHDVQYNGDCLFSAVSYQLEPTGECAISSELRRLVADHLENNCGVYCDFVSEPVASDNSSNADTEAPSDDDAYIATVADPQLQSRLRWERYVQRLRNGAWGDHIALQGIADMLNITVHVLSSQTQAMTHVVPRSGTSQHDVYVGLILQYHYVGLDQVCMDIDMTVRSNSPKDTPPTRTDNPLDDDSIEKGDEHVMQITGGPQASMMSLENPEALEQTVSTAPAEGQKPLAIMTDKDFEAMFNPDKFCFGTGAFSSGRPRKITYRKYFNQRLLDVDGRFARDLDYLFVAQYIVEAKQVLDDGNNFIWRQRPSSQLTASQAKDKAVLGQCVRNDQAYRFMKNIRGSPPYYQRTFYELLAMIRQLGTPTWFFTLSAADLKWPDMIQTIAKQYGVHYTDEQVMALTFEQKSNWLRRNPVTAARHFQYRLNTFFQEFLKSTAHPLGEIVDYGIRIEFQARGSPHAHCVIWIKDAPKYGVNEDSEVCDFIDQYVSCDIPKEEGKLKELVLLLQQHKHASYCKRHNKCRFNFPHPPSPRTLIAKPECEKEVVDRAQSVLSKVHGVIGDGHTSLEDVLEQAEVTNSEYMEALGVSGKGNVVVLRREPSECYINNYNGPVMLAWQANMDLQYVLNAYACVMYVASYIMKTDRAMGELLKRVTAEARTEELRAQLKKVGSAFLTHREVSAQEAVYRILSLPMKQLSRTVVFVDTNPINERIAVLKDNQALSRLDDDDTNVFQKSLVDRYTHRPRHIQSMCLAEFAATFAVNYKSSDESECDALPPSDSETTSSQITLTDGFGKMKRRKREAVIRFRRYNKDCEPSNWYRAKLMLYFPWYDEQSDLLGGYSTYEEHYRNVYPTVSTNEEKYSQNHVDDIDIDEDGPPEHLWSEIAPSTEENRTQSMAEGSESLTEVSQEDLNHNADLFTPTNSSLQVRFESAANAPEIPADEYRRLMRELNDQQRTIVMFHRDWCRRAVLALKEHRQVEPYHVFLSGPGGVGKSHVIRLIHSDTLKFLRLSGSIEPDDVIVLLTAPTGVAAFNIGGITLHSAFLLGRSKYSGFQPLSHDRINSLRSKLSHLMLVIIDEVSMVGSNMLLEVHKRLQQIKGVSDDVTFGGVSILAVGDLYQLPPVGQSQLFSRVSDGYAQLYRSGSLWVDEFDMIELDQIMRQRGDEKFSQLLCRVRTNECTPEDLEVLKSREITPNSPNYPSHVLHVYRLNTDVGTRNKLMLDALAPESEQYTIKASDSVGGQTTHIDLSTLSDKRSETGGLHSVLKLAVGARVMLTANVDVADGLVNGARGEVVHVVTSPGDQVVTTVLVVFDNHVGLRAVQSSPYRSRFPNAVSLAKQEVMFLARGKKGSEVTRLQFPLTLAWATTIHKVQGLTLDEIVVDMKGGRFSPGQAYVAFSRVKTLQGLHILNFNAASIKRSADVQTEMVRLSSRLLPTLPQFGCPDNCISIALLNVRSIVAKLPDIDNDSSLKRASILCFCETWLVPSQRSPLIMDDQVDIRCDRATGDNKGGVLIACPRSMEPSHTYGFACPGIEAVSTILLLPNSRRLQVVLLYRSPVVPLQSLIHFLSQILDRVVVSGVPSVVLGDFNENILGNHESRVVSLMSSYGYTQLVKSPTTPQGSTIDHLYYTHPSDSVTVSVKDTYYTDHDSVYSCIPTE